MGQGQLCLPPPQDVPHLGEMGRDTPPPPPPQPHLSLSEGLCDSHPMLVAHHVGPPLHWVCFELWER